MGGNLFEESIRISKEEYDRIVSFIMENTKDYFEVLDVEIEAPWKEDYGDIDFLYLNKGSIRWKELKNIIPYTKIVRSGSITSILFENKYHIDFQKSNMIDYHKWLNSYGGIHNIIGSSLKKINMKLSTDGIYYQTGMIKIHLSSDIYKITQFLNLDYSRFLEGFSTREDLFDYIMACPIINISSANKKMKRNFRRPIFLDFFQYIDSKKIIFKPKSYNPEEIVDFFDKTSQYLFELKTIKEVNLMKKFFNGNYISKKTQKSGPELGLFMKKLREHPNHKEIFLTQNQDLIDNHILLNLK